MMIKVENGSVTDKSYSVSKLKADNPSVSFPADVPESILNTYNAYTVTVGARPSINHATQAVKQTISQVDGVWTCSYTVVNLSDAEVAKANRRLRGIKLQETDYFALTDVTMDAAMTTYRQALRDITAHANWPNLGDDDWPVKP